MVDIVGKTDSGECCDGTVDAQGSLSYCCNEASYWVGNGDGKNRRICISCYEDVRAGKATLATLPSRLLQKLAVKATKGWWFPCEVTDPRGAMPDVAVFGRTLLRNWSEAGKVTIRSDQVPKNPEADALLVAALQRILPEVILLLSELEERDDYEYFEMISGIHRKLHELVQESDVK
tara:strand:- start:42983 stop:43513 length:531 start_codon:yes stop_codon:yes gene_type:complete